MATAPAPLSFATDALPFYDLKVGFMKKILPFLVIVLLSQAATAQKLTIRGQLTDTVASPLPSATIMILLAKDSSLVNFGATDLNGFFEIKNVARNEYLIKVSYVGFAPYMQKFSAPAGAQEVVLGQIRLQPKSKLLNEIVILGDKPPVTVKKDTIEFNAGSFKVKQNGTAEDLIKKLPGMEVDNDGTIRAQGETVQRVMVEGKEFFGQDPKLATRNLPADAVEKVQVYDKKSDQTVFSGIDDGQREKTINLALKEDKKHAAFGNDMAGVGTNNRFSAKASLNRFNNGNQMSFLGMGNNINEQGFSIGDYVNFNGTPGGGGGQTTGAQANTGRQNGIVTNYAGGMNLNQAYNNNKTKITASYFYNRLNQNLRTITHRINYLPNGSYNFDQVSQQNTLNDNHRVNVTFEQKLDSVNSVKSNVNVTYNQQNVATSSQGLTMNVGNKTLKNAVDQSNTNNANSVTLNSNMLLRHRFAKKGRTISSNLTFAYTSNSSNGSLTSKNLYYDNLGNKQDSTNVQQINTQTTTSPTYGINTSFTEPLGNRRYLEVDYNLTSDLNYVDRPVYDLKGDVQTINDSLSNKYQSNYLYSRPGVNLRVNRDKFNVTVGSAWQQTRLTGNLILKDARINRLFQAVLPVLHFNYDFSNFKHLRIDYTTSMQEPTITQLQPIVNNSDQLNQTTGNPYLKPAYAHQFRSNFTVFDPGNFMNVFAFITGNYTANSIVSSQTTNAQLVRTTKPVNVRNSMALTGNFNLGIPLKVINSRFNFGPTYSGTQSINLTNEIQNVMTQQTLGGTARYNYSLKDILIVDLSANLSKQDTRYSFSTTQNQSFFNKTYSGEVNLNFLKNYAFNTEMDYYIYNSPTTNFHQTIPLWNLTISRFLLKNKTGELKFGVNNLLNRSLSVIQTASTNYLQQQTMNNLGRYFMVSFTYALNKQLNPIGGGGGGRGGRGGPMRMMIRQ